MNSEPVKDADGNFYEYRLVSSRLERRATSSGYWHPVTGTDFERMTAAELRHVADVLDRVTAPQEVEGAPEDIYYHRVRGVHLLRRCLEEWGEDQSATGEVLIRIIREYLGEEKNGDAKR